MSLDPKQVQDVFLAALEGTDTFSRATILDARCRGDQLLRGRVEALLKAHDDPSELAPLPLSSLAPPLEPGGNYASGTTIAKRYELLEEIAEGGMGTVWLAQQSHPVRRQVALKLIKPGMDSRRVLGRFDAERQALAMMNHPHIAQVFDGGLTEWGHPFFAMEYVDGAPVTEDCEKFRMPLADRLRLFVKICEAIQHAHRKGIIHRDLKPSNVLVTRRDDEVAPKVIDFGLAKAMFEPLTVETLDTAQGHLAGTPRYMSPEQSRFDHLDIDTRSDVYSLGVLLYELITGDTPLTTQELRDASWPTVVESIQQGESPRPSSRLRQSPNLAELAAARGADSASLLRAVSGDLDAIVLKALEKDPSRRYQAVSDLARDVQRYLTGEPVEARVPTAGYRFRKFARRNRAALATAAAISAALVLATAVSLTQAVRARTAERAAANERDQAQRERARAEANFQNARQAVDDYFTSVSQSKLLDVPGLQPLRKELLDSALTYYRQFIDRYGKDRAVQAELASAYIRVGNITAQIGSRNDALAAFDDAVRVLERLVAEHPESAAYRDQLASAINLRGNIHRGLAQPAAAEADFRRALALREKLVAENPQSATYQSPLVATWSNLGFVQGVLGRLDEAKVSYETAIALAEQVVAAHPENDRYASVLARTFNELGILERKAGRLQDAENAYRLAIEIREQLVRKYPQDREQAESLETNYNNLFVALVEKGEIVEAEAAFQQSVNFYQQQVEANPSVFEYRRELANSYNNLGAVQRMAKRFAEGQASLESSIRLYQELSEQHPGVGEYRTALGMAHYNLGVLHAVAGRADQAADAWTNANETYAAAVAMGYATIESLTGLGDTHGVLGHWREAAAAFTRAAEVSNDAWKPLYQAALLQLAVDDEAAYHDSCERLLARYGDDSDVAICVAVAMACMAGDQATSDMNRVLDIMRRAAESNPKNPVFQTLVGALEHRAGNSQTAIATLKKTLPMHTLAAYAAPRQLDQIRISRIMGETILALALREVGDQQALEKQITALRKILDTLEQNQPQYSEGIARWALPLTIYSARKELARLESQTSPTAEPQSETDPASP